MRRGAALLLVLSLCACAKTQTLYSGTLHTEAIDLGSTTGGRVVAVLVAAGDPVRARQVVLRLDDRAEAAAVAQAQAALAQGQAQLADLIAGPRAAEVERSVAQVDQAQATAQKVARAQGTEIAAATAQMRDAQDAARAAQAALLLAEQTYARERVLGATGDVSQQIVDQARSSRDQARAALASARQRATRARAQLTEIVHAQAPFDPAAASAAARAARASEQLVREGARPEQIAAARASVRAAAAALQATRVRLEETVIRSPLDGSIEAIDLHPGDLLAPRATAAVLDSLQDPYVRIYVPQSGLGAFVRGAHVRVRSDAVPGVIFEGVDEEHDSSAQFTPRDVQTADDRADLTFGVKIRIRDPKHQLRGGTTVSVSPP